MSSAPSAYTTPAALKTAMEGLQDMFLNSVYSGTVFDEVMRHEPAIVSVLLSQELGKGDAQIQSVLDNTHFQFFWQFVTAWLEFRQDPNADRDQFLFVQRQSAARFNDKKVVVKKGDTAAGTAAAGKGRAVLDSQPQRSRSQPNGTDENAPDADDRQRPTPTSTKPSSKADARNTSHGVSSLPVSENPRPMPNNPKDVGMAVKAAAKDGPHQREPRPQQQTTNPKPQRPTTNIANNPLVASALKTTHSRNKAKGSLLPSALNTKLQQEIERRAPSAGPARKSVAPDHEDLPLQAAPPRGPKHRLPADVGQTHGNPSSRPRSLERYMDFNDVNDDSDGYLPQSPSPSPTKKQSKRKRMEKEPTTTKKSKVSGKSEKDKPAEESKTGKTLGPDEGDSNKKVAPREEPQATRYVFTAPCDRCEKFNRVCREQYKPGQNGGACYTCSRQRVKCEGERKGKVVQAVGENEVIIGSLMDEVCQEEPKPKPRGRSVKSKKMVNASESEKEDDSAKSKLAARTKAEKPTIGGSGKAESTERGQTPISTKSRSPSMSPPNDDPESKPPTGSVTYGSKRPPPPTSTLHPDPVNILPKPNINLQTQYTAVDGYRMEGDLPQPTYVEPSLWNILEPLENISSAPVSGSDSSSGYTPTLNSLADKLWAKIEKKLDAKLEILTALVGEMREHLGLGPIPTLPTVPRVMVTPATPRFPHNLRASVDPNPNSTTDGNDVDIDMKTEAAPGPPENTATAADNHIGPRVDHGLAQAPPPHSTSIQDRGVGNSTTPQVHRPVFDKPLADPATKTSIQDRGVGNFITPQVHHPAFDKPLADPATKARSATPNAGVSQHQNNKAPFKNEKLSKPSPNGSVQHSLVVAADVRAPAAAAKSRKTVVVPGDGMEID